MNYPISEELLVIYEYMAWSLKKANVRKDAEPLEPLMEVVDGLRETWQEVSQKNRGSLYQSEKTQQVETQL